MKRLEWAKKYTEEGSNGFKDVIFTDETSVQLDCYRQFSYRKAGSLPRPKPRCMLYYNHFTCHGLASTKSWWEWLSHNLKLVHSKASPQSSTLQPRPFFAGKEKRPGTICLNIPRKVGIPDISGLYSHT